jgi:subtilase family serine protease
MKKPMRVSRSTALAVTTASVLFAGAATAGVTTAGAATQAGSGRVAIASTAPVSGLGPLSVLAAGSRVRLSVFVGRDQAGLAAVAAAVSDPASPSYGHYLGAAQVRARFGATAGQEAAVRGWLTGAGLTVTGDDGFVVSAMGTAARAEAALGAGLALSRPAGDTAQVVPVRAVSVPAAVAGAITTIRVSPAVVPRSPHEPLQASGASVRGSTAAGSQAAAAVAAKCSAYYGQKKATGLPKAYGRTLTWAPCGYQPAQLRKAYGATTSGLTGAGASVAVISESPDSTALGDTNRWARQRDFPAFARGQFSAYGEANAGFDDDEDSLDIEAVHGMAPAAKVDFVVGSGQVTGDILLDGLDMVVRRRLADAVTSSWDEYQLGSAPASVIRSWEGVLERAAAEGITVDFASGDFSNVLGLQYPSSDPWITAVGGTSLAIGATGAALWETGWSSEETYLAKNGKSWSPAPPGPAGGGSTGGVSKQFAEPSYQDGVVSGNTWHGKRMRAVPDVSALGDPELGYQIGLTTTVGNSSQTKFEDMAIGGTSLSAPVFAGFEADLIQGRGGKRLGFANPLLYRAAHSAAFHDVTSSPQGRGYIEAVAAVLTGTFDHGGTILSTMGQCGAHKTLTCGPGYDMVTGLGSPGPAFFRSFGSRPK